MLALIDLVVFEVIVALKFGGASSHRVCSFQQVVAKESVAGFIAVFKIKSHIHMNETTLNSQKGKHSERRVGLHWEEHPVTLP